MAKASDNAFPSVLLAEQGSAPTTPAAGHARGYVGADGLWRTVDDAGTVTAYGAGGGIPTLEYYHVASASGSVALTTSPQDVPGVTVNVAVDGTSDVYIVITHFDVNTTTASAGNLVFGLLNVDGSDRGTIAVSSMQAIGRHTVGKTWVVTGLAAGTKVFKLRAQKSGAGGVASAESNSDITVIRVA